LESSVINSGTIEADHIGVLMMRQNVSNAGLITADGDSLMVIGAAVSNPFTITNLNTISASNEATHGRRQRHFPAASSTKV